MFKSPQAATAAKQKIESFGDDQHNSKQFTAVFANPFTNPFKTLPKDGPARNNGTTNPSRPNNFGGSGQSPANSGFNNNNNSNHNNSAGFRGGRGGNFGSSRGGMNAMGGFNRGGYNQTGSPGFQGPSMGGFPNNPMANMQSYGGFQNRGAMMGGVRGGPMGMRGGRGGMIGMPMNGMGFGAMGMGMGMNMPQMPNMGMPGEQAALRLPVLKLSPCSIISQATHPSECFDPRLCTCCRHEFPCTFTCADSSDFALRPEGVLLRSLPSRLTSTV